MTLLLLLDGEVAFQEESDTEAEEGAHEAEPEDPPNPVLPVGNELLWAAVFFFSLWALMKFVLLPPIQRGRAERADAIRADKDGAEVAQGDLVGAKREYEEALASARTDANAVIDEARAEADQYRAGLQTEADTEIGTLREQAMVEIDRARRDALGGMTEDVGALAVQAASMVIEEPIDAGAQQAILDRVLGDER